MTLEQKLTLALAHCRMSESEVASAVGMSGQRFRRKMETNAFTLGELEKICRAIGANLRADFVFPDDIKRGKNT